MMEDWGEKVPVYVVFVEVTVEEFGTSGQVDLKEGAMGTGRSGKQGGSVVGRGEGTWTGGDSSPSQSPQHI